MASFEYIGLLDRVFFSPFVPARYWNETTMFSDRIFVGSLFGNKKEYKYLSDSTRAFPQREGFIELMEQSGLRVDKTVELMLGIVIIYVGVKKL